MDRQIAILKTQMDETNPNVQILALYRTKRSEFLDKERQLRELEENLTKRRHDHEQLRSKRHDEFKEGF